MSLSLLFALTILSLQDDTECKNEIVMFIYADLSSFSLPVYLISS